jgi:predicted AAA+ superfamily ATPase
MINLSTMGNDCGISHNTVREWLSVLEASYIIFLLPPYTQKVSSRVRKSPKLFFIDPGLVATLLGIYSVDHLMQHPARGHLFESLMVSECLKQAFNRRLPFTGYFWRDREGHEIDIIIDRPDGPIAIECKASHTIRTDDFRHLIYFGSKAEIPVDRRYLLYGGDDSYSRSDAQVLSWKDVADGTIIF